MKHAAVLSGWSLLILASQAVCQQLPGSTSLTMEGDLAKVMVQGIDRHLTKALDSAEEKRRALWKPDFSSPEALAKSLAPHRERLKNILGIVDRRETPAALEYVSTTKQAALVARGGIYYQVYQVRWPVLPGVYGEGLLLEPKGKVAASVIAVPDADWTPEMLVGLEPGIPRSAQFARWLAENGCRVVVPVLIDRKETYAGNAKINRWTNQPHREFVYRMAFEMGRHIIGYEVQKLQALVDIFTRDKSHPPVGIYGYGEGGLLALYSGALDTRIDAVGVSGYFGPRENVWQEPIYRNLFGLLRAFGDAEIAALIAPRWFMVEGSLRPKVDGPPPPSKGRAGAAPGVIEPKGDLKGTLRQIEKTANFWTSLDKGLAQRVSFNASAFQGYGFAAPGLLEDLHERKLKFIEAADVTEPMDLRKNFDPALRHKRQFDELVHYTQKLLPESTFRRQEFFWSKIDTTSLERYEKSVQPLRDHFWDEIIGRLPEPSVPLNPRTRLIYDEPKWKGYEVVLDVYEDVISYGILLVPNDIKPGEKRPVVVCQHGLEGRPTDVVDPKTKTKYYNSFGARLADQGFVVFAPQNPYIFRDEFRQLVRKANPLKLTLYSFIVRQHQQILEWLGTLGFVDAARIAYYGLSYGGKVAMRIPALLAGYCAVICSGDFNEWIWKNITLDWTGSYMFTGEYEMFEWNLGNTFNYAEMAALIAPRPFMVERGHNDGVGLDEYVAFEYAKVRRLYAKLGIAERTEIEFFQGGHEIHGQGTFAFLRRHLQWPAEK